VYHHPVEALIRLSEPATGPLRVHARYQGCNEPLGVCYPPIDKTLTVTPVSLSTAGAPQQALPADHSETARVRRLFAGGLLPLLATFFGLGVLLAFTPCMLPMLPILSGIVVGQGQHAPRRHTLVLSSAYVLGMAITYAAAGVAAGLAGSLLSAYLQNPVMLFAFAAIFVVLALAMFDVYRLQLPSRLQSAAAKVSQRFPGGRAATVFVMGGVSALIVGPCVAAPLAGALLYIGQTHDALLGGVALFTLAIGMGVPLLLVGTTAAGLLRRAGPLSLSLQRMFGVVMLALAIYVVSPVVPVVAQQLLWATLLIVSSMFVHALDPLPVDAPGHRRLFKGVGVIGLVLGLATLAGALGGNADLLHPLAGLRATSAPAAESPVFQPVRSTADLDARLRAAAGREVMLDFWAEWCVSCKEMDRLTFTDPRVRARMQTMLLLRADVTGNTADDQALLRRFSLFGPPGIVFFDSQGREQPERVIGFEQPDEFLASLARALPRAISTLQRSSP
jgi:thioredoxin:protein disulfide reductase